MNSVTDGVFTIRDSPGGELYLTDAILRIFAEEGVRIEVWGRCVSACTMVLGHPDVCAGPNARFEFHGATALYSDGTTRPSVEGTQFMLDHMPDGIRAMLPRAEDMTAARWHRYRAMHLRSRMDLPNC